MTSQGQRFRRRALRRGYKVDEVDAFLDRVEGTLAGDPVSDAPVSAQEVHDVVFRVRFGGYDEWQVDLHLDRVERQLAELEERSTPYGRQQQQARVPGPLERGGPPPGMAPPMRDDRMMPPPPMRDDRSMPPPPMRDDRMTVRDDRGPGRDDFMPGRDIPGRDMPGRDMPGRDERMPVRDDRMPARDEFMPPRDDRMPVRDDRMMPPPVAPPPMGAPPGAPRPAPPKMPAGPPPGNYDRYDEPTRFGGGYDDTFEPGRHGKSDMTTELRMPDGGFDTGGFPVGPPTPAMPPEAMRIDQLRRTFQLRRFGSGYDRMQVDRLFEGIVDAMSGRSNVSVSENELDPGQFSLVPGGYFEAEVDAALKEVRDILARRR